MHIKFNKYYVKYNFSTYKSKTFFIYIESFFSVIGWDTNAADRRNQFKNRKRGRHREREGKEIGREGEKREREGERNGKR